MANIEIYYISEDLLFILIKGLTIIILGHKVTQ